MINAVLGWRGALGGVSLGLLLRFLVVLQSSASHPYPQNIDGDGDTVVDPHSHVKSMTEFSTDRLCAIVLEGNVDQPTMLGRIKATLLGDNPAEDWNGLRGGKVAFAAATEPCNITSAVVQIEYWVLDNACGVANPLNLSCAFPNSVPVQNPLTGHQEFVRFKVIFDPAHATGTEFDRYIINHETGHVLGLEDGGPQNPSGVATPCTGSVMHIYGCDNWGPWPTAEDRASVESLIPASGGGSPGGGSKGFF